ncbi:MAG: hypothetical protein IJI82_05770, partial [Clostridia bacterium]|nr:hypothetical protein [Clostridia bacterium]
PAEEDAVDLTVRAKLFPLPHLQHQRIGVLDEKPVTFARKGQKVAVSAFLSAEWDMQIQPELICFRHT